MPNLSVDAKYSFKKSSRYICNYIEREVLKELKFTTKGFDRISISVVSQPTSGIPINTFHVACVQVAAPDSVLTRTGVELTRIQIDLLRLGIGQCAEIHHIPQEEILQGLDLFQKQGFKNTWIPKNRIFRDFDLAAKLVCEMTQDRFSLRLYVTHRGVVVYDDIILETDPDEVAFAHKFKDIELTGGKLIVTAKAKGSKLWERPLTELMGTLGSGSDK